MEVELYVYDLSRGMARTMSRQLLGIQIDAVYHTSLVLHNREIFYGAGIQECRPGTTHHGAPIERIPMGLTHLPEDTIDEYLESLKQVYSAGSYDLFEHNCNNFSNDFGMFLVGKGIPEHITALPRRVLDTPFGAMLRPQIDASMRSVTQAPVAPQPAAARPSSVESSPIANGAAIAKPPGTYGRVINVASLETLNTHLETAINTAATIFFTSSTCAPCRVAYPTFDKLAEQHPEALFVKVDINSAQDVASRYQIRATPTFVTISRQVKHDEWSGADPALLKTNVERLLQITFPPHPHVRLNVPTFKYGSMKPVTFPKMPPLDKLMAKLGPAGKASGLVALQTFLHKRSTDPKSAALPDLGMIGQTYQSQVLGLPSEVRFAAVDLLRAAMVDPRVSGFFAEENGASTVLTLIQHVNELSDCPHNLRLVTIHLACNIFASPLYVKELLTPASRLATLIIHLITSSLLDTSHPTTRVAASSLALNLVVANYRVRREESREAVPEGEQVELAASLIETLPGEDSVEARQTEVLALGFLLYFAPPDGELMDLCQALDAKASVAGLVEREKAAREVAMLL